jgi:hypothetical protein
MFVPFDLALKELPIALMGRPSASRDVILPNEQGMYVETTFDVERVFKGSSPKLVRLYEMATAERIRFDRAIGEPFIIFATELTKLDREKFAVPTTVRAFLVNHCASKPAKSHDLSPLGSGQPPRS